MILSLEKIHKKFPRKTVLNDISLSFESAKINVIAGENGAGKSTLVNILSGSACCDSGKIFFCDESGKKELLFATEKDALDNGIALVRQVPLVAESITCRQNILLGVKASKEIKTDLELLVKKWCPSLELDKKAVHTNAADHFYMALLNALIRKPAVLILDEPGSMLSPRQKNSLYQNLQELKSLSVNVIVITHNLNEILEYADTVTYLKSGNLIFSKDISVCKTIEEKKSQLNQFITDMNNAVTGQKISAAENKSGNDLLQKKKFCVEYKDMDCHPVDHPGIFKSSFSFSSGQLVLVQGSRESGLETLEDILYMMADFKKTGTLVIKGNKEISLDIEKTDIRKFFKAFNSCGIKVGIIPSDKNYRGSNPGITVLQMLTVHLETNSSKRRLAFARYIIKKANVNITPYEKVSNLSGGMLQKLLLERELFCKPDVLFMCSAFQGLDIKNTQLLKNRIKEFAGVNRCVILLSPDDILKEDAASYYRLEGGKLCRIF